MKIFKTKRELQHYLSSKQNIGFVPTMGALHDGHITLLQECNSYCDTSVVSIYVNPTQFNDIADFNKYPSQVSTDIEQLLKANCDVLFLPDTKEMYGDSAPYTMKYDLGYLEEVFEGKHRPGHFQGVCTIVEKLINAVNPHKMFMGAKDFQQCKVIEFLLQKMGSNIQLIICNTVRELDGLAKSSRNVRLSNSARALASQLYSTLQYVKSQKGVQDFNRVKEEAEVKLKSMGFQVEYLALANSNNLKPCDNYQNDINQVILIAALIDGVRLIDNMNLD